jgi:hypothetical protein
MLTLAFVNFWPSAGEIQDTWFQDFFQATLVQPHQNPDLLICSCFGPLLRIQNTKAKYKIFFTGEHLDRYPPYNDLPLLQKYVDLILGFNPTNLQEKQLRFPLWLLYFPFYSAKTDPNLLTYLQEKYHQPASRERVAACIARHDRDGVRTYLCNLVSKEIPVLCPGKFNNNCPPIGSAVKDKLAFLQKVTYNICPENTKAKGYHTEKVFQAFEAGCIPIYSAYEYPEAELLSPDAVVFINEISLPPQKVTTLFTPNAPFILDYMYETLRRTVLQVPQKVFGISYASRQFQARESIITKEAPFFHSFQCWTEKDIGDDFKTKFAPIWDDSTRGGGWWIWKPYIVLQTLQKMQEGDILVYLDSGCTINNTEKSNQQFQKYLHIVNNHWSGFLRFALEHKEKDYTNSYMLEFMKNRFEVPEEKMKIFSEQPMLHATVFILRKNKFTVSFFEECMKIIEEDPFLLNEQYTKPDEKHRHDQSLLSMLYKVKNVDCVLPDETWFASGFHTPEAKQFPFLASRHRS